MNRLSFTSAAVGGVQIDHLIWALLAVSLAVLVLVFGLMLVFTVRYRASRAFDRGALPEKSWRIEIAWTTATLLVFFGLFVWGASLFMQIATPPANAYRIHVVGKQWMWKIAYPDGQKEINSLHVPVGRPVELVMTSEDVIHDLAIPAFRIKHDVLPGRYDSLWFEASRPGVYHLLCTQFCGTDHAAMTGAVIALSEADFTRWLAAQPMPGDLAAAGRDLFAANGCAGCHDGAGTVRAPGLAGLWGAPVTLADGRLLTADETYLRDAILHPERQRVAGYAPTMPSFAGRLGEDELLRLVAYIRSLALPGGPMGGEEEKDGVR